LGARRFIRVFTLPVKILATFTGFVFLTGCGLALEHSSDSVQTGVLTKVGPMVLIFEDRSAYDEFNLGKCINVTFSSRFDRELRKREGKRVVVTVEDLGTQYPKSDGIAYRKFHGRPFDIWCDDERLFNMKSIIE
jgi:hypothetical protein